MREMPTTPLKTLGVVSSSGVQTGVACGRRRLDGDSPWWTSVEFEGLFTVRLRARVVRDPDASEDYQGRS